MKEILEYALEQAGQKRLLAPMPSFIASFKARFLELLPEPPLTRDQIKLLAHDNVVSDGAAGLDALGIQPTPVGAVVPGYLGRFKGAQPKAAAAN